MDCPSCGGPGEQRSAIWSRHMMGTEADIVIPRVEIDKLADFCETIPQVKNIGRYWNFVHVGIGGNSDHRWDMRRKMDKVFKFLGGQKFSCCLILILISCTFFAVGKLDQVGFLDLLKWAFVTFSLTHGATDIAATIKGK